MPAGPAAPQSHPWLTQVISAAGHKWRHRTEVWRETTSPILLLMRVGPAPQKSDMKDTLAAKMLGALVRLAQAVETAGGIVGWKA